MYDDARTPGIAGQLACSMSVELKRGSDGTPNWSVGLKTAIGEVEADGSYHGKVNFIHRDFRPGEV